MSSVVHFAVYCDDEERAIAFYGGVFGWRFEPWGPPGFHRLFTGPGPGVTEGALSRRTAPRGEGAPNAWRCTVSVADVDATLARVVVHGGTVPEPAVVLPGIGKVAEFVDTEGNLVCAMQYESGDLRAARG
ncbi:MAG: VOC family protein [Myxococcota bacterium]